MGHCEECGVGHANASSRTGLTSPILPYPAFCLPFRQPLPCVLHGKENDIRFCKASNQIGDRRHRDFLIS